VCFRGCGDGSANAAYIGNLNIIDWVNSSIQKLSWNGLVGAKGSMTCQSLKGYFEQAEMMEAG
jgi:hypothetical protein